MEPSCPLGTTNCIPQAKFPQKANGVTSDYNIFQVVLIYWCTYHVLFLSILQLGHRLSPLHKTSWSEQTKDEIKQVMTVEYTSSDESSYEPDSDSEVLQLQSYQVKHLKWERTRLTSVKQTLDNVYLKSLPEHLISMIRRNFWQSLKKFCWWHSEPP